MPFSLLLAGSAERNPLIDCTAITDLGSLSDHHARTVVDQHTSAYLCAGMDLNASQKSGELANHPRGEIAFMLIKPVRRSMQHDRMQAARNQQCFQAAAGGWIALLDCGNILFKRLKHQTDLLFSPVEHGTKKPSSGIDPDEGG